VAPVLTVVLPTVEPRALLAETMRLPALTVAGAAKRFAAESRSWEVELFWVRLVRAEPREPETVMAPEPAPELTKAPVGLTAPERVMLPEEEVWVVRVPVPVILEATVKGAVFLLERVVLAGLRERVPARVRALEALFWMMFFVMEEIEVLTKNGVTEEPE